MAMYVENDDLIGLGDGQIVRHKKTGELGLLVEVDDEDDAEIGYDDGDDEDDDDEDWEVAGEDEDEDDDEEEVGRRRRKKSGGGKARRKARRSGRQNRREDRREARQERHEDRRESDVPDRNDVTNRTLQGSQTVTGAGTLNIVITPQDDFWVDDITVGTGSLTNTLITMIRVGDTIVEDWPDGVNIADLASTLAISRKYGKDSFCPRGLSIRITGSFPGAGLCKINVHGRQPKKTSRCG